jgi:GNAT superfamily N-acetyltransferase
MENEIHIKQFELSEKDALFAFLRNTHADDPRQSDPQYWNWHYRKCLFSTPDNIPLWIAKSGEKIVGQLGAIPVELNVAKETRRAIWILDFMVHPDFRRYGIGKKLVLAMNEVYPTMLTLITHEQHTLKLLQKLDWKFVGNIRRYSKVVCAGNAVREIAKITPLRAVVNTAFSFLRSKYPANIAIRKIERFDETFDEFWEQAGAQKKCSVARTADILNWQYVEQPGKKFDIFGFYESEKLHGYIVMFFRKADKNGVIAKAAITDICYSDHRTENSLEVIDALLKTALNAAAERGVGALVTDVIDPLIEGRLKHFDFWAVKNPLLLVAKTDDRQDLVYDLENWFITRGDSDVSIFEEPNL